ncbi:MAG: sulfotransferase [Planctomycetales bacterium]
MSTNREFITVVSGLPRSGTSMMMQMVSAGGIEVLSDHIRKADEDNTEGYYEFEPVKRTRDDGSWLPGAAGKAVKVIYMLLADLPADFQYRVVFLRRNISEVLASQKVMLSRRGEQGADLSVDKLVGLFQRQLQQTEKWLSDQQHLQVLYVDYHQIVEDPMVQANRVSEFLGGLDTKAMAGVVDPALYRQRDA